jgi:hypothetical protein
MNAFSSDRPALLILDVVKDNLDEKNLHPPKASTSKLGHLPQKHSLSAFQDFDVRTTAGRT